MGQSRSIPFYISLADIIIRIEPIYDYIKEYCRGYIVDGKEEFTVRTEPKDICYERERSIKDGLINLSDEYLETLAVYRKIVEKLPQFHILLFHASAIAVDGTGYLFTAKSGVGKSTHSRLWREYLGERAVMINDDKPLVKVTDTEVTVYGTPWNGKHRLGTNMSVPLKAVSVLIRERDNRIEEIKPEEVYGMLLQQCYRPIDQEAMRQTLFLVDKWMKLTKFYKLECNMEPEVAKMAYLAMKGDGI